MRAERVGDRVVVLGASMAGLLAARVLADRFAEVVLVDRDKVTTARGYRPGVPHGRHAHGIGLGAVGVDPFDMTAAGVRPGDFNGDVRWYFNGRRARPGHSGLLCVPATRPVLEHHVREHVRRISNVAFLDGRDILGLTTTPDAARVTGVRVRDRDGDRAEELGADLVLDTTGRGSRTPAWLAEMGYARPPEDRVTIGLAYTTRHYRVKHDPLGTDLAIAPAPTPAHPRGAFFYRLPGEEGRMELSLTGMLGDHPPVDPDGFLAFAASLPVPDIHAAVKDAEPLDDPVTFRYPASLRRRYERLTRFPDRLLVLGDALCSFNPLYAQGMTVCAMESLELRDQLAGGIPEPLRFLKAMAGVIDGPWDFSAGADLAFPGVKGKRTPKVRLVNAYAARLQRATVHDSALTNAFIRAAGLIDPPQALMRPATLLRVLRHSIRPTTD